MQNQPFKFFKGADMRRLFSSWILTLATTFVSFSAASQLDGRPSCWTDAGFTSVSSPDDCWYEPDKAYAKKIMSDRYCLTDLGVSAFVGIDNFRGIPDADAGDNNGVLVGLNIASPLPGLKSHGVGFQIGGSYGAYDFAGRGHTRHNKAIQSQGFVTAGFFIRPQPCTPLSLGVVYDVMFNQNFSLYAEDPLLQQVRGQIAYFLGSCNEIGVWGAYETASSHKIYKNRTYDYTISYRAISQANLFWRHLFSGGVESIVWAGAPIRNRLNKDHSKRPGKFIVGLELSVPFLESWALIGRASYMQPGTKKGVLGSKEYTSNIAINLVYYIGGNPNLSEDPSTGAWMPYLPLANNSNFFVDASTKVKFKSGY